MLSRSDIAAAAERIGAHVRHTPVLRVDNVALKLEFLQHTGSFKPRGAFNRLMSGAVPSGGVIAASGGNHGAAVAYAAQALGHVAEIFVPARTPSTKVNRIRSYGARVHLIGDAYADSLAASRARQAETGALEIHAYDHIDVLAGQGTVGKEFETDAPDLTHILVAVGGGGLIGGVAGWYAGSAKVIGVEPESCPTLHAALQAGAPVDVEVGGLASDSLGARRVGALMFPVAQAYVDRVVLVSDADIAAARRWLWNAARIVVEPGGATAMAALLSGRFTAEQGAGIGVVVCGANTDPATLSND